MVAIVEGHHYSWHAGPKCRWHRALVKRIRASYLAEVVIDGMTRTVPVTELAPERTEVGHV